MQQVGKYCSSLKEETQIMAWVTSYFCEYLHWKSAQRLSYLSLRSVYHMLLVLSEPWQDAIEIQCPNAHILTFKGKEKK